MLYCQHCGSRGTIKHNTGCPNNTEPEPLTEEERTILAHYRGDCHDGATCPACKSERGWYEKVSRLESLPRQDVVVGVLNTDERLVVRHLRGEHSHITVTTCALCVAPNGVDGQPLTPQERRAVSHARGEHVTKSPGCVACVVRQQRDEAESRVRTQRTEVSNYPAVDDVQLNHAEVRAVRHLRNEHTSEVYGCTACTLRKSRDSAEAKVRQQEGTIRRQTATITALEAGVRDAQQRLNSIIEG